MCNIALDNYVHSLEFVPDYYKTQKMCNKAVNTSPSAMQLIPECCKTQEMYVKVVGFCISLCFWLIQDSKNLW